MNYKKMYKSIFLYNRFFMLFYIFMILYNILREQFAQAILFVFLFAVFLFFSLKNEKIYKKKMKDQIVESKLNKHNNIDG